jgi:hypothetical protein
MSSINNPFLALDEDAPRAAAPAKSEAKSESAKAAKPATSGKGACRCDSQNFDKCASHRRAFTQ